MVLLFVFVLSILLMGALGFIALSFRCDLTSKAVLYKIFARLGKTPECFGPVERYAPYRRLRNVSNGTHRPLLLNLETSEGSGQACHPDVAYIPEGFGEKKWTYWMACTPYPYRDAYFENPELFVSHDGINWADAWKRYTAEGTWRYDILETGYKYNLTDLQASLGIAQLSKCEAMWARRAALAERYNNALSPLDAFEIPYVPQDVKHAWHLYVVQVNSSALRIDRNRVIEELKNRGIGTSVHFIPLHLHTLYQERLGYRSGQFPNAEERFERAISLPIYPGMTGEDSDRVIEALHGIAREYRR